MWNDNRPSHGAPVIVLSIQRTLKAPPLCGCKPALRQEIIISPEICIEVFVPKNVVKITVIIVGSGLGVERFDSACGSPNFSRER